MIFGVIALFAISVITRVDSSFSDELSRLYTIQVVNEFPHDPEAFTQGLLYAGNDTIFESTGLYGQSSVRTVSLPSGKVEAFQPMNKSYFGEGLTLLGERLFQVIWLTQTGFIYDNSNLHEIKKFSHQMNDGWGLATDGKVLFGSDGTSTLYQLDPQAFEVIQNNNLRYGNHEVNSLNEVEYVNGEVWANVWQTDCIAQISPKDGTLLGWILLDELREGLVADGHGDIDGLNGIAWDSKNNRLFAVTNALVFNVFPSPTPPKSVKIALCFRQLMAKYFAGGEFSASCLDDPDVTGKETAPKHRKITAKTCDKINL